MSTEPRATYRLQLHGGFSFDDAAELAPYLEAIGVSHVYSSPYLQAASGSTHGYDVVDPNRVNEELGGMRAHERFCAALGRSSLGQLLDIVPNHMAITGRDNRWWWDVLENGPSSRYASYFDVDWHSPEEKLRDKILLSVLGDHYGRVLEAGELQLVREGGVFVVRYHEHLFPVAPRSLDRAFARAAVIAGSDLLAFLADAHARLPAATATDREATGRRHRDKEVLRRLFTRLMEEDDEARRAIDDVVAALNEDPDQLDAILERQSYRLAWWRTARWELSYRRFFDISDLAAMRMDDPHAFEDSHRLILHWLRRGVVDGVRVDHLDGLRDPEDYLDKLHAACPDGWLVVEKILEAEEELRESWPVAGTTGYDFLNQVSGLLVDPAGEAPLTALYQEVTGVYQRFCELAHEKKELILRRVLLSDVSRLAALFLEVCERHRRHRDYTREQLQEALIAVLACFPVYRTYVRAGVPVSSVDRAHIESAVEAARGAYPEVEGELLDLLRRLLILDIPGDLEAELATRFQQLSGPVMAKGVEDTALYGYHRLISLNEVGSDPSRFGLPVSAFHATCARRQARWPRALLCTSTHDTKRSEDVRARLHVLSEVPERWAQLVRRWTAAHEPYKRDELPDRNTEYLLYQTVVGAWPIETDRVLAYMEKASREAKAHTSWIDPNPRYDGALRSFIEHVLDDDGFKGEVAAFVAEIDVAGRVNSLAQTLLKLTAPGVPDLYQGTELWDHSLVDPDNRRPVDFELRRRLLREIGDLGAREVWQRLDEGLPKLWLTERALRLRRERPAPFSAAGTYRALQARGEEAERVVAFARSDEVVTVVPRLTARLQTWGDTSLALPEGEWRSVLTDETFAGEVRAGALFSRFPVGLLARRGKR